MIPKVSDFKQQQYLFGSWIWMWAEFGREQVNSILLSGSWEAWKAGGCGVWRLFAHVYGVNCGCQLGPPPGLWLKHVYIAWHVVGFQGWISQKDQEAVILTYITQPQKPHGITSTMVTGSHVFKGREQRLCLSMKECQHHIFRRDILVQPSLENTTTTKYKAGKTNLWS